MNRCLDIIFSLLGLIFLSPIFVLAAAAVRLSSPGPVFFCQTRVGQRGREFKMYKFRTMTHDTPQRGLLTAANDQRITAIGRILRAIKVDELPQLINVLRGEMSLVGPRPEIPELVATYTPQQRKLLNVRPGITGIASLAFRREETMIPAGVDIEEYHRRVLVPAKAALELAYLQRRTMWSDLRILAATILPLIQPPSVGQKEKP